MNPMHAAIRSKRMSGHSAPMSESEMAPQSAPAHGPGAHDEPGKDLHGFVASLSGHEKMQLKGILDQGAKPNAIASGEPSSEEQGKIQQMASNQDQGGLSLPEDESDEIGKSMLDSRFKNGSMDGKQPRNLGERVKMAIAGKLKSKGKI